MTNLLKSIGLPIERFTDREAASGILLLISAALAVGLTNSQWGPMFQSFWQTPLGGQVGNYALQKPIVLWVNDGLMAVFFLLVGLEIKRELLVGELSDMRAAALPIAAAVGGMVVPAGIYLSINGTEQNAEGWAIPMATDIAFSLGILALCGRRLPVTIKIFLTALAIVDDVGAVLVIALFYTASIQIELLVAAGIIFFILFGFNRVGVRSLWFYLIPGLVVWFLFLKSGVHATIAGILLAQLIPVQTRTDTNAFTTDMRQLIDRFAQNGQPGRHIITQPDRQQSLHLMRERCNAIETPLEKLEHALLLPVSFLIMPVFALANAGFSFDSFSEITLGGVFPAVALGLALGKPIGIVVFTYAAIRLGLARMPAGTGFGHILGAGLLAGIGFTMSLFIAGLAFEDKTLEITRAAIIMGSLLAGISGFLLLRWVNHLTSPR
ncbi:MAG: Na+/H+ antiporter NhaA [Leptospiraceae bacterium]|nr:Na+/H+ antiporter NhaA [Leptospiraceae bacterium]